MVAGGYLSTDHTWRSLDQETPEGPSEPDQCACEKLYATSPLGAGILQLSYLGLLEQCLGCV